MISAQVLPNAPPSTTAPHPQALGCMYLSLSPSLSLAFSHFLSSSPSLLQVSFRKSTPPQNRQLNISVRNSEQ